MLDRMIRVFKVEPAVFEEVEADHDATGQAAVVVVIASVLWGAGPSLLHFNPFSLLHGVVAALLAWLVFAALTYVVGTRLFAGQADLGEMLRVLGFATTPLVLGVVPLVGWVVGGIWFLVAMVVAVRQGLDVSTGKAIATVVIAGVGYAAATFLVGVVLLHLAHASVR